MNFKTPTSLACNIIRAGLILLLIKSNHSPHLPAIQSRMITKRICHHFRCQNLKLKPKVSCENEKCGGCDLHLSIIIQKQVFSQLGIPYRVPDSGCPGYNNELQLTQTKVPKNPRNRMGNHLISRYLRYSLKEVLWVQTISNYWIHRAKALGGYAGPFKTCYCMMWLTVSVTQLPTFFHDSWGYIKGSSLGLQLEQTLNIEQISLLFLWANVLEANTFDPQEKETKPLSKLQAVRKLLGFFVSSVFLFQLW